MEGSGSDGDQCEERRAEYLAAIELAVWEGSDDGRDEYRRLYKRAWDNRECMFCLLPVDRPHTSRLAREDGSPRGPNVLTHLDCWEVYLRRHGLATKDRVVPTSVGPDGTITSRGEALRDENARQVVEVVQTPRGTIHARCRLCGISTVPMPTVDDAVHQLKQHMAEVHPQLGRSRARGCSGGTYSEA